MSIESRNNARRFMGQVFRFTLSVILVLAILWVVSSSYRRVVVTECKPVYTSLDGAHHPLEYFAVSPATGSLAACLYDADHEGVVYGPEGRNSVSPTHTPVD